MSTALRFATAMGAALLFLSEQGLAAEPETVRVAVIGGMVETGFWDNVAQRFEKATGHRVELVATGPKAYIAAPFQEGQADLITMHSSDTIINLVADGYAVNPQPWLKNDLVIVGAADDPAGIRGLKDAVSAMRKIRESGSAFVGHASLGAEEVLRDILFAGDLTLDPDKTTMIFSDRAREVLQVAASKHAYTLVGRIPFLNGKLPNAGMELMVQGDPRLRRPYVVAVADPRRFPAARVAAATRLAEFLRQEDTQAWIAEYGRGELDDQPLFFRVVAPAGK
jgi:tungstate transport system substrate-binding protein